MTEGGSSWPETFAFFRSRCSSRRRLARNFPFPIQEVADSIQVDNIRAGSILGGSTRVGNIRADSILSRANIRRVSIRRNIRRANILKAASDCRAA